MNCSLNQRDQPAPLMLGPDEKFSKTELNEIVTFQKCFLKRKKDSFHSSLALTVEIGGIWPPKGIAVLDPREIPFLNTLIPLSSGAAVTWAHHAILAGKEKRAVYALVATVSLALVFTAFQGMEYYQAPSIISDSIYGSTFFLATGSHGFHVIIGTLFSIICGIRQYLGHLTKEHHVGFEAAAWYWHFVDVVRLFPFVSIYWWGDPIPRFDCSPYVYRTDPISYVQELIPSPHITHSHAISLFTRKIFLFKTDRFLQSAGGLVDVGPQSKRPCVAKGTFCSELKARALSLPSLSTLAKIFLFKTDRFPQSAGGLVDVGPQTNVDKEGREGALAINSKQNVPSEPNQRANTPTTKEQEWVVPRNGRKEVLVQPDMSDRTGVDQRHAPSARNDYKPIEGVCLLVQLRTRCRTRLITDHLSKRLFKGRMPRIVPLYTKSRHAWDFRTRLSCPKSKKQVTPNPPEGGSKATSKGDWIKGEGPSNSEVGSQYTDTHVIDSDHSLVTGEHYEGKPALAFSTPTGISLGGTSEPPTLSPNHKPLGGCEPKERPDEMKLDQQERKHDQSNLVSEVGRE
nr:cytochrome c oxidase subunit 3, mitochondrial [Tanacetum cinerariifolium]